MRWRDLLTSWTETRKDTRGHPGTDQAPSTAPIGREERVHSFAEGMAKARVQGGGMGTEMDLGGGRERRLAREALEDMVRASGDQAGRHLVEDPCPRRPTPRRRDGCC